MGYIQFLWVLGLVCVAGFILVLVIAAHVYQRSKSATFRWYVKNGD